MRYCKDCLLFECVNRTPLGGCGGFEQVAEPIMITSNHETKVEFKTDWEQVRIQAAIAAMQGYCSLQEVFANYPEEQVAGLAVKQADALVEELKKEK